MTINSIVGAISVSILMSTLTYAQCDEYYQMWASDLHANGSVDLEKAACKVWPANPNLTIAALPIAHHDNDANVGTYDLKVLVADSLTGSVYAHIYQPSAIQYDAINLTGIAIDTARYQLKSDKRAFGVRISYSGSSAIFPMDTTSLDLYVIDERVLRPVLNHFVVEARNGDWDGLCEGVFNTTVRSIDLGSPGQEGYAALKISEKHIHSVSKMTDAGCATKDQSITRTNSVISYRNGEYQVPGKMKIKF
jgi:hypothetical protein